MTQSTQEPVITDHGTYTKTVTKNKVRPKDGGEPLTVIEFSLTNEIKEELKTALDTYRRSEDKNSVSLTQIINDHFPSQVLEELRKLGKKGGTSATVYVVHNLPEITEAEIAAYPKKQRKDNWRHKMANWIKDRSYSYDISTGIGLALDLIDRHGHCLLRFAHDTTFSGSDIHRHGNPVTMLGGVITNGAATRFIDGKTLCESQESADITVLHKGNKIALSNLEPDLDSLYAIIPENIDPDHQAAYSQLLANHSQEIVISGGDLVLWAEDGHIFHQALAKKGPRLPNNELVRCIMEHEFRRPDAAKIQPNSL